MKEKLYEVYNEQEVLVYSTTSELDATIMAALYNGMYIEKQAEELEIAPPDIEDDEWEEDWYEDYDDCGFNPYEGCYTWDC